MKKNLKSNSFYPQRMVLMIKSAMLFCCILLFSHSNLSGQNTFELDGSQSMLMTGKGKGQDGAINPYFGENCLAVVENLSENEFEVRIQRKGKITSIEKVKPGKTLEIKLLADAELYLDSELKSKARLEFKKLD